ncbi:cell division protein DivIVA, partial [Streptococcus suis]
KDKANEILRNATDNEKKVVIETEELKNQTRIFHQRLKSTVESQLSLVNSSEWEDILRPSASYIQTSDVAFRDVLHKALD